MREICESCGKVTRHYARGVCHRCYSRAFQRRYSKTKRYKVWRKKYQESTNFIRWQKAYFRTEAYKVSHARYYLKSISLKARLKLFEEMMGHEK